MKKSTQLILKKFGVPQHLSGYDYLGEAIDLVCADRSYLRSITIRLYPAIAKKFSTTAYVIERRCRSAVEVSCRNLTADGVEELYGNTINPDKGKPTTAHFIAAAAEMVAAMEENDG